MDQFLSNDKHKVLFFAESHNIALELWFEHTHRRRHQALRKISYVQHLSVDEILELMLEFQLIL